MTFRSVGVAPEVNQNGDISGPTKVLMSSKNVKENMTFILPRNELKFEWMYNVYNISTDTVLWLTLLFIYCGWKLFLVERLRYNIVIALLAIRWSEFYWLIDKNGFVIDFVARHFVRLIRSIGTFSMTVTFRIFKRRFILEVSASVSTLTSFQSKNS